MMLKKVLKNCSIHLIICFISNLSISIDKCLTIFLDDLFLLLNFENDIVDFFMEMSSTF